MRQALVVITLSAALGACTATHPSPVVELGFRPNPVTRLPSTAPCPPGAPCTTTLWHAPFTLLVTSSVDTHLEGVEVRVVRSADGTPLSTRLVNTSDIVLAAGSNRLAAGEQFSVDLGTSFELRSGEAPDLLLEVTANVSAGSTPGVQKTVRVSLN